MMKRTVLVLLACSLLALWALRSGRRVFPSEPSAPPAVSEARIAERELETLRDAASTASRLPVGQPEEGIPEPLTVLAVSSSDSSPIPFVRVAYENALVDDEVHQEWIDDSNPSRSPHIRITNDQGVATLDCYSGQAIVARRRHAETKVEVRVAPPLVDAHENRLEIRLDDHRLTTDVHVVARHDGSPIPLADVTVEGESSYLWKNGTIQDAGPSLLEADTDESGKVTIQVPAWRSWNLRVRAEGFSPVFGQVNSVHSDPDEPVKVSLQRSAAIDLVLVHDHSSLIAEVQTLSTNLWTSEVAFAHPVHAKWVLGPLSEASHSLEGLPGDLPLDLRILSSRKEVMYARSIQLVPGEVTTLQIDLSNETTVQGTVFDTARAPLSGLSVWMVPGDSTTEVADYISVFAKPQDTCLSLDGSFKFSHVPTGQWLIGLDPTIREYTARPGVLRISAPGGAHRMDIVVDKGQMVSGRVLAPGRGPVTGPAVDVVARQDGHLEVIRHANVAADGLFEIGPFEPGGSFQLRAEGNGLYASSNWVAVSAGEEDIVLVLQRGNQIRGALEGLRPDPSAILSVSAIPVDLSPDRDWVTMKLSGAGDAFFLAGLKAGDYNVFVDTEDGLHGMVTEVPAGADDVSITLRKGARLRVKGTDGRIRVWLGHLLVGGADMRGGADERLVVPVGNLTIGFLEGGSNRWKKQTVLAVANRECTVAFP